MREVVLDASVVMKWFAGRTERGSARARRLRDRYREGGLLVTVPRLLFLELLNVAARRWSWHEDALIELALGLEDLQFDVADPDLDRVATWAARGLTAYDAAYVALAESRDVDLITDDDRILELAGGVARPLRG